MLNYHHFRDENWSSSNTKVTKVDIFDTVVTASNKDETTKERLLGS